MGAVMGSKNLKAIAAKGSGRKEMADSEKIREISQWLLDDGKLRYKGMQDHGTDGGLGGGSAPGSDKTEATQTTRLDDEYRRSLELWLERIPDNPGALLREKFRREAETDSRRVPGETPW